MARLILGLLIALAGFLISWRSEAAEGESSKSTEHSLVLSVEVTGYPTPAELRAVVEIKPGEESPTSVALVGGRPTEIRVPHSLVRVSTRADRYWASDRILWVDEDQDVTIRLHPTVAIRGAVVVEREGPYPDDLFLDFATSAIDAGIEGTSICVFTDTSRFSCELPRLVLDLRFRAHGFIPQRRWDVDLAVEEARVVGEIPMIRGTSLAGWVVDGAGRPVTDARVSITPARPGEWVGSKDQQRLASMAERTSTNIRGFFQLEGIAPGGYTLEASHAGRSSRRSIDVGQDQRIEITDPLVVRPPASLLVQIVPVSDPYGNRWAVHLERPRGFAGPASRASGRVDENGTWSADDLEPGPWDLLVTTVSDAWYQERILLESERQAHTIEIPVVPVEGRVYAGKYPLAADLSFGAPGEPLIGVTSNKQGEFFTYLPREGEWPVRVLLQHGATRQPSVDVRRPPGGGPARVEIVVPDTEVEGEVVDASGHRVPHALVGAAQWLVSEAAVHSVSSDSDGRFLFRGLRPGSTTFTAHAPSGVSDSVTAEVLDGGSTPPVRLVLGNLRRLHGTVVGPVSAVPGALVKLTDHVPGSPFQPIHTVVSGADGSFSVEVRENAAWLDVLLLPPGFAARLNRLPIVDGGALELAVTDVSGTLVVPNPRAPGRSNLRLTHGGASVSLSSFDRWKRGEADRWVLDSIEWGDYELCRSSHCDRGFLPPGGRLELDLSDRDSDPGPGSAGENAGGTNTHPPPQVR